MAEGWRRWLPASPRAKGARAEREAADWLRRRGLTILERNHRNAGGEIDLIARDGGTLCFVEVKARSRAEFGGAIAAVDRRKRERLRRAASVYLARRPHDGPCRFDVVTFDRNEGEWRVRHYEDAF